MYFATATIILVVVAILFISVQPFKDSMSHFTTLNVSFVLLLALWYTCMIGTIESIKKPTQLVPLLLAMATITAILPLLYVSAIVLHWMYSQRKFGRNVITRLRAWKNGYDMI
jgi:hypothetical protein